GIYPQQALLRIGKQMAVCQLHHADGTGKTLGIRCHIAAPSEFPAMMATDAPTIQRLAHNSEQKMPLRTRAVHPLSAPGAAAGRSGRGAGNSPAIHRESG